jgi:hypothetical protein
MGETGAPTCTVAVVELAVEPRHRVADGDRSDTGSAATEVPLTSVTLVIERVSGTNN